MPALDASVMEGIPPLAFLAPEEQPQGRTRPRTESVPRVTDVLWAAGAAVWGEECLKPVCIARKQLWLAAAHE